MATRIPEGASIMTVVNAVDGTCAALESDPETKALALTWAALRDKGDELAKKRSECDRALARARARLAVCDAKWDTVVAAFGRAVVDASGGRRDQPPYTRFFGKTTPSASQGYGTSREIALGQQWLAELKRSPDEALAQVWMSRLGDATSALETAFKERNESVSALGLLQTSVVLLIDDINRELDRLEGDLKKLFPGQAERVGSYLAATRRSAAEPAVDPTAPAATAATAPAAT